MNTNLFRPPLVGVEDTISPNDKRPRAVDIAVLLLWIAVSIPVIRAIFNTLGAPPGNFDAAVWMLVDICTVLGPIPFLTVMISQGMNWARIALLVIIVIGVSAVILRFPYQFAALDIFFLLVDCFLQVAAVGLLFVGPGRHYFPAKIRI